MPLDLIETHTVTDDGSVHLAGATQVVSTTLAGVTYVAVASADSGISIFTLSKTGILTPVAEYIGGWAASGFSSLEFVKVGGTPFLVARTIGSNDVVSFSLAPGGALTQLEWNEHVFMEGGEHLTTVQVGGATYLIGDGQSGIGFASMAAFRLNADGSMSLISLANFGLVGSPQTINDMSVVKLGATTLLVASAQYDDQSGGSLGLYFIREDGQFEWIATPLGARAWVSSATAVIGGVAYVYAATASELVTFTIAADGTLTEIATTSLGNQPGRLTTGVIDGVTYLFQSDATGLTVFEIAANGDLTVVDTVADSAGNHLTLAGKGLVVSVEGIEMYVAPSATENGLTVLTGNPIFDTGAGSEWFQGTDNGDIINGGDGDDVLLGGLGDDVISGGAGEDILAGEDGNDRLAGGAEDDNLQGGIGDDQLDGGDGADWLYGGDGTDTLKGGAGADLMYGGDGDDTYLVDDSGDFISEQDGEDTVYATVQYALAINVENLILLGANQNLQGFGNFLANVISGTSGANVLWGRAGNDTISGGAGDDVLHGEADDDILNGDAGHDTLYGGDGHDSLYGGVGNDTLYGEAGVNNLYGGKGNDTYILTGGGDTIHEDASGGGDTVILRAGAGHTLAANVENLVIEVSGVFAQGNALNNAIAGGVGDDSIYGFAGNDSISGGDGADRLFGGDGADVLAGGEGADVLVGGAGSDRMTGGLGGDAFVFDQPDVALSGSGGVAVKDYILDLDFSQGDVVDLTGIDADANTAGDQDFVFVTKFTKVAGQALIKYTASNNTTTVTLDVDGDGKGDLQILITGDHSGTTSNSGSDGNGGWLL